MAQMKLNTIQIVLMANYKNLLIQIKHMAHICENDMIQIKDMIQIVATWLQLSTEEYRLRSKARPDDLNTKEGLHSKYTEEYLGCIEISFLQSSVVCTYTFAKLSINGRWKPCYV